jgi:hypothetical protein
MGKKVNSYAVFGVNYWGACSQVLRIHHAFHRTPDWEIRIHHDNTLDQTPYKGVLLELQDKGLLKLQLVNEPVLKTRAMLWRMMPIWDSSVDYVFCKDMDSLITTRERKISEHFSTNCPYAAMGINDNPSHSIALMGGMCGFNTRKFIELTGIKNYQQLIGLGHYTDGEWQTHGTDQVLLNSAVLPRLQHSLILYRVYPNANRLHGGFHQFSIPSVSIPNVSQELLDNGDSITGYIGACGAAGGPKYPYIVMSKYGNQEFNSLIESLEKKYNVEVNI